MADRPDSFMPLYIGDYLRDTLRLTTIQHGAYFLLICAYWAADDPLPDDDDALAAITKMSVPDWKKIRPVLSGFFQVDKGLWHHKRVDSELCNANAMYERRKSAAHASHDARRKKGISNAPARHHARQVQPQPQPHPDGDRALTAPGPSGARQPAHDSPAAAGAPGPAGWEANHPRWATWREAVGEAMWNLWFAGCRPNGSETSIVASSYFTGAEIAKRFGDQLTVHFSAPVKINYPRSGTVSADGGPEYAEVEY